MRRSKVSLFGIGEGSVSPDKVADLVFLEILLMLGSVPAGVGVAKWWPFVQGQCPEGA
jgi:hypothetical protein